MFEGTARDDRLNRLHEQIAGIYQWWHREAPDVRPREEGLLATLWAEVDELESETERAA